MTRRAALPLQIANRPFHVGEARSIGVSASRLRARDLLTPTRGVRTPHHDDDPGIRAMARRMAPALLPWQFFSHETALALIGCPMPALPHRVPVHVSAHRPFGAPRRSGLVGHRLQSRDPSFRVLEGLPIEHPARAWRQAATLWELDELIVAADHLVCPRRRLLRLEDLRAELGSMGDVRGHLLAMALEQARVGSESPEETRLRLAIARAGLPEPELNLQIRDAAARPIARLDLAYPRYRVGVEYDGRVHAEDTRQFERDADRWDDIRASGWQHVRILRHHMRPDPSIAVSKVATALLSAGWLPGAPSSSGR